eukprot:CAMPEP_0185035428 /NCGR_PEP_ID=MMETSP1103-20130426/26766_1 /TAXON_ID=36769 /ORGANISM="Paraphysomonas bandaiensis, Strain Caron Lab Isolate" /LENGTH=726 /DNA_ID=CAMNT_0027572497 /DNA_START=540 /DNA_END=2720 /DNA_ORIENTATION=+
MRRYHSIVWIFSFLITFALYNQPSCQGRVEDGICWLQISDTHDPCLWGYYFVWIVCMYGFQLGALIFASQRLKKGLPLTFEIRKKCALETFKCLTSFGAYLLLLCFFFIVLVSSHPNNGYDQSTWKTFSKVFLYIVSCRGYVDGLVWFWQHDFASDDTHKPSVHRKKTLDGDTEDEEADWGSEVRDGGLLPYSQKVGQEDGSRSESGGSGFDDVFGDVVEFTVVDFDETDLSPQVNIALRQQIVKYVTMGVSKATAGSYPSDRRSGSNPFMQALCSCADVLKSIGTKRDPILSEIGVSEFMLENEHPFKAFAPDLFEEIRLLEGIDNSMYLSALESTEKEQLSEGASGAFMFFCGGMDFIVKTIKPAEAKVLHRSLRQYKDYLKENPSSLLVRFLGSYSLGVYAQTFHFVVMRNIFEPGVDVNERFDIKGSWVNRSADPSPPNKRVVCRHCNEMFLPSSEEKCPKIVGFHEANVVLKDNDLRTKISLRPRDAVNVLDIIKKDSNLLAELGVMDYSLIVGIKKRTFDITAEDEDDGNSSRELLSSEFYSQPTGGSGLRFSTGKKKYSSFRAKSVSGPAVYYMGIVDFLQDWNTRKKIERAVKVYIGRHDPHGISVMKPQPYRDRFQLKMEQIFDTEDPLGLFIDRGSVTTRSSERIDSLATPDTKSRLPSSSYNEVQQSTETTINAMHISTNSTVDSTKSNDHQSNRKFLSLHSRLSTVEIEDGMGF